MQSEYNANLLFEDRVNKVTNEITNAFPEIDIGLARLIAILEEPISSENEEVIVKRLLSIINICNNDKIIKKATSELLERYKKIIGKDKIIDELVSQIIN